MQTPTSKTWCHLNIGLNLLKHFSDKISFEFNCYWMLRVKFIWKWLRSQSPNSKSLQSSRKNIYIQYTQMEYWNKRGQNDFLNLISFIFHFSDHLPSDNHETLLLLLLTWKWFNRTKHHFNFHFISFLFFIDFSLCSLAENEYTSFVHPFFRSFHQRTITRKKIWSEQCIALSKIKIF